MGSPERLRRTVAASRGTAGTRTSTGLRIMLIHFAIDVGDLGHPAAAIGVLECHDLVVRPMKVKRDEGYLPVQLVEGVA